MRIQDMKRSGREISLYAAVLKDDTGAADYELRINGLRALVEKAFAKSEFEVVISPKATEKDAQSRAQEMWEKHSRAAAVPAEVEDIKSFFKKAPPTATPRGSIVVSLRRTRGKGSFWTAWFPELFVPGGVSLFFFLPTVCNCFGTLFPLSGDPDLFLSLNSPTAPVVAASTLPGLAIDSVSFGPWICWHWAEFVPWFRVFGSLTSVTGFWFGGFGVFP